MIYSMEEANVFSVGSDDINPGILLDEFDDFILILDEAFTIRYSNKACCSFLGNEFGEPVGMSFFQLLPPKQVQTTELKLKDCLRRRNTKYEFDHDILLKDGCTENFSSFAVSGKLSDHKTYIIVHLKNISSLVVNKRIELSDAKYEAIVECAPDPIFIETDNQFAYLNTAACTFFGVASPEELIGTPILDRIQPGNREIVEERIRRLNIERKQVADFFEQEFIRVDGGAVWAQTKGEPIVYDGKNGALVFMRDVTERRAAEEALEKSEVKYAILFNEATIPILLTTYPGLEIVEVNEAWTKMLGYSREEVIGKRSDDLGITQYSPKIRDLMEMIENRGFANNIELTIYTKAGQELTMLSNIHSFEIDNDRYAVITNQDITDRKKAEEKLREVSERYQKFFDYSPIGMCLTDLNGLILNVNNKMCQIFGYSKEELEGWDIAEITYAEDLVITDENIRRINDGEVSSLSFEKRYVRSTGEVFWSYVVVTVLMGSDGRPEQCIVQIQDITERKRMEEELRAREQFNQAVMDNLPIGISVNSYIPPLRFEYMNDNFPNLYRTTREALKGTDRFFDAVYEDREFREAIRARVLDDMQSGDPKRLRWENIPITRKGAQTKYITAYNTQVPDKEMQISIVVDETERVQTLETLEKNAARFGKLHEFDQEILKGFESYEKIGETALSYATEIIGSDSAGLAVFRTAEHMIETVTAKKGDPGYRHCEAVFVDEEAELYRQLRRATVYRPEEIPDEKLIANIQNLFKLDGLTPGLIRPLYSAQDPIGVLFIGRRDGGFTREDMDMVQEIGIQTALAIEQLRLQKQNEQYATELEEMIHERTSQLEVAVKELEAFTYSVSHDLRAPLRSMNGFVRILLEDYGTLLDDEGKRICGIIGGSAQQMGKLIDDLLSLSRIGRSSMALMPMNMAHMVKGLFFELTTEEQRSGIEFSADRLPEATADPTLIRQVWMNLLDNAIKFSSKTLTPHIRVIGTDNGREIVFSVSDNGAGFDMQYQDKLFGVFQRLHSIKEFDGTGVGLAIVQRIIERHGGRVWAEGEVNKGATFYFSLKKETISDDTGSN